MKSNLEQLKMIENGLLQIFFLFWINRMPDYENGGFYGRITAENSVEPKSARPKGGILNSRILWTFSKRATLLTINTKEIADRD
jgi:mannobiose 2-epimerase